MRRTLPGRQPDRLIVTGAGLCCLFLLGCGASQPKAVPRPDVDPADAAASAMKEYDANGDGALAEEELAKCPPLAKALAAYDADGNGQLTAEEISSRLTRLFGSGSALTNVDCTVRLGGRPLAGATVKLRPVAMLGEGVQPAEGTTDATGAVRPSIDDANLPENLQGTPMMQPGLYHVEITHPQQQIPAKYNTETELGFEVDPASRGGTSATFDLKS